MTGSRPGKYPRRCAIVTLATPLATEPATGEWWHDAVVYHVYLRSFRDSNGDGIGDIHGLISRLDYLAWLGVDAVWCSPVSRSANRDHGYDVLDYCDVDPSLGTLADVDELVAHARRLGIRVLLDFVPNHTSIDHPWFQDPRTKRDWYVWSDEPNNWMSSFHNSTWTWDDEVGRYYLHSYSAGQPDLNWRNEEVRREFDRILRFWLDRGIAGFRIDACYLLVKDRWLRDNPVAGRGDHPWDINRGQRPVFNAHRPELHDLLRRWRQLADGYDPPGLLLGATWAPEPAQLAEYYGEGNELQLAQNYLLPCAPFEAAELREVVESWLAELGDRGAPVWLASDHDHLGRLASRWCDGDPAKVRLALSMLLTLPGTVILYQGDELGLEDVPVREEQQQDLVEPTRDVARTPMPWTSGEQAGFTAGEPWLPPGSPDAPNVCAQLADTGSVLHHTRQLIALRRRAAGAYQPLDADPGHWRYRRGELCVDLDFGQSQASLSGLPGLAGLTRLGHKEAW
jgi:alpha-glucosidase